MVVVFGSWAVEMTAPGLPAMLMVPLGSGWLVKVMRLPAAVWLVFIVLCGVYVIGECVSPIPLTSVCWCGRAILFRSTSCAHPVLVLAELLHAVRSRSELGQKSGCSAELVLRWLTRTRLCRHCRRPFSWRIRCSRCRVCVISLIRCLLFAPLSLSTLFPIGGFSCAHTHSRVLARTDC